MSFTWNGRDVEMVEFDIAVGEAIMLEAAKADDKEQKRSVYLTLVASARYADDHSQVFTSVEEIRRLPFRLMGKVMRLAAEASRVNQIEDAGGPLDVARADAVAPARAGNGAHDPRAATDNVVAGNEPVAGV